MRKLRLDELNRPSVHEYRSLRKLPLVVVLDNIRSALNVGSIFRTADAFAVERIYLCGITARPPHREINKTAIGATESVEWAYGENCLAILEELDRTGYEILIVEQTSQRVRLDNFCPDASKRYALVFGNEVNGVSDEVVERFKRSVEIPQFGTKHSLNVAVAAGIVMWKFALTYFK